MQVGLSVCACVAIDSVTINKKNKNPSQAFAEVKKRSASMAPERIAGIQRGINSVCVCTQMSLSIVDVCDGVVSAQFARLCSCHL